MILAFVLKPQAYIREMMNSKIILVLLSNLLFRFVSVIAKPMASKKLAKKVYKVRFTLAHHRFYQNIECVGAIISYFIKR